MISDCTCQGFNQVYECRVVGEGATIWRGTALECSEAGNEIVLFQSTTAQGECNNGAIVGRVIRAENNSYTSQLTVTVNTEMIGRNISCIHDNGVSANVIGSSVLTITTGIQMQFRNRCSSPILITCVQYNTSHQMMSTLLKQAPANSPFNGAWFHLAVMLFNTT